MGILGGSDNWLRLGLGVQVCTNEWIGNRRQRIACGHIIHLFKNADGCENEQVHGLRIVDRFASVLGRTRIKFSCWGEDSLSCGLGDFAFSPACHYNAAIAITSTAGKIATGFFSAAFRVNVV